MELYLKNTQEITFYLGTSECLKQTSEHKKSNNNLLFRGPTFIEYLDSLPSFNRSIDGPLRMPIIERYKVCLDNLKLQNEIDV